MSKREFFVTGTDTGVGKTRVATGFLLAAGQRGLRTMGIKPLAAGAQRRAATAGEQWVNEDALELQASSSLDLEYGLVNPFLMRMPIAPHIAATQAGLKLTVADFTAHFEKLRTLDADLTIVEGAGGWAVPINDSETLADVCVALHMPAILVVGMRLGCLNHASLTADAICAEGIELAGWVANCLEPEMAAQDENLGFLRRRLPGPCLGVVPCMPSGGTAARVAGVLDIDVLMERPVGG
jgi:dethiobiotin synthetase